MVGCHPEWLSSIVNENKLPLSRLRTSALGDRFAVPRGVDCRTPARAEVTALSMNIKNVFGRINIQIVDFLASLAAGIFLVLLGLAAWWFVNRIVVQLLVVLRLHRLLAGFRWARGLSRVDVRMSIYSVAGSIAGLVTFLVFLDSALAIMGLVVRSGTVEQAVLVIPRVLLAEVVFVFGMLVSAAAAGAARRVLPREAVGHAALIASYVRGTLLVLFGAMALAPLGVAREIVIIGFTVIFVTLATLMVLVAARREKELLRRLLEHQHDPSA
jgi:hypothetical protein